MIIDQAERLRRLMKRKELGLDIEFATFVEDELSMKKRVVSFICSEEEALACSNLLANIAVAMSKRGKRVVVVDTREEKIDAGIPLGIAPVPPVSETLRNNRRISSLVHTGAEGVKFIKMGDVGGVLNTVGFEAKKQFINQWMALEEQVDIIIMSEVTPVFSLTVSEVVVITSAAHHMVTASYGKVKYLVQNTKETHPSLDVLTHMCHTEKEAKAVAKRFIATVRRFLGVDMGDLGSVLLDPDMVKALKSRAPFVVKYPYSPAAAQVNAVADRLFERDLAHGVEIRRVWEG